MDSPEASVVTAALFFMGAMLHVMYTDLTTQRIHNSVITISNARFLAANVWANG